MASNVTDLGEARQRKASKKPTGGKGKGKGGKKQNGKSAAANAEAAEATQSTEAAESTEAESSDGAEKRQYTCGHCGKEGHNRRKCPDLGTDGDAESKAQAEKPKVCALCGFEGHVVADCPDRDMAPQYPTPEAAVQAGLQNAGATLTPEEVEQIRRRIIDRFDAWRTSVQERRHVDKETKDQSTTAEEKFREAIESDPEDATDRGHAEHLHKIKTLWGEYLEARETGREQRRKAREKVTHALGQLEQAIDNSRQLDLPLS